MGAALPLNFLPGHTAEQISTEEACFVDLPLNPTTLNERLMELGIWVAGREQPHQAIVRFLPQQDLVRISFSNQGDAWAFNAYFRPEASPRLLSGLSREHK